MKQNVPGVWKPASGVTLFAVLAALAAASAWAVYAVPAPVVDRIIGTDLRKQAIQWRHAVLLHVEDGAAVFTTGQLAAHDVEYLSLLPKISDVYRFKLYNAAGSVIWSTRSPDIGTENTKP
mgnify:CR=1 FL=1